MSVKISSLNTASTINSGDDINIAGNNPLYFSDWGGGWYMQDGTWMRNYAKSLWIGSGVYGTDGGLTIGYGGGAPPSAGAIIAGNVGIGTSSPAYKLQVSGGRTGLFSGDNFSLGLAQTVGQANYFYLGTNSSGDLLMSDTSGSAKLTITQAGAATFSSSVTATSLIKSGGTSTQYLMADGSTSTLTNPVSGSGTTNYLPKWTSGSAIGNSAITDDGTTITLISRALSGTSATFSGNANADDYSIAAWKILDWTGSVAQIGGISASQWNQLEFFTSGTSKLTITSAGNVGVGTTSPATTLHVAQNNGAITLTRESGLYGTKITQSNSDGSINYQIGLATAGAWSTYMKLGEGETSPALMLQPYGNNVLIGTTTDAGYKLDVNGTARVQSDLTVYSTGLGLILKSQDNTGSYIKFSHNSAGDYAYIGSAYNLLVSPYSLTTDLAIRAEGALVLTSGGLTPRLIIASTGAATFSSSVTAATGLFNTATRWNSEIVGIQITDSGSVSAVKAALRVSNNGSGYIPKIILTDNNIVDATITMKANGTTATNYLSFGLGSSYNILNVLENGNVGIGTTTPLNKLVAVNDGVYNSENSYAIAAAAASDPAYKTIIGYDWVNDIGIIAAVQTAVAWKNISIPQGNLLIGTTTNAGYKLDVNGTGNFSAGLTVTKTAKNTYGIQIKGGFYGAPRLQLYDLAVDGNAFLGLGTDMSGSPYESSNYFPRYSGLGRWSVGSWAGAFGTGQYVSGYNEKLWINESSAAFNIPLNVVGALTESGNQVLHAGNYNSYAPTLTGTGASGTWSINVTGTSYYSTSTSNIVLTSLGTGSVNVNNGSTAVYRNENGNGGNLPYSPVLHVGGSDTMWQIQGTYGTTGNGTLYFRQGYSGSWGNWLTMISSANIGSQSVASAVTLTSTQGNWSSTGVISNVVGLLAWKNYNNNHVIFDASQGTSPSGGVVDQTNSTNAWAVSFPTLMGWNGVSTYGVRVDSARVADALTSMNISQFTNNSGYITSASLAGYLPLAGGNLTGDLTVNTKVYVGTHGCYFEEVLIGSTYELRVVDSAGNMTIIS